MFDLKNKKEPLEKLIGILENSMHEEGYITKRYSETSKFGTTSYDCLILRDEDGEEYTLTINERVFYNREYGRWEASNDLANEAANTMKFYEFSGADFGYYALIGDKSEEEAIKYYSKIVGDIEDEDAEPIQIMKGTAFSSLLNACKDNDEGSRIILTKEFNKLSLGIEPYLVLIDGSLL